ncbi:toll-like receptor 8 isoform X1 [Styela clava]
MNRLHLLLVTICCVQVSYCKYDCIENCACEIRQDLVIANCTGRNFTEVPQPEPKQKQVNVLYLQYNRITRLRTGDFSLFNKLKELHIQVNGIDTIEESAFDGLVKLEVLDISKNRISSIPESNMKTLSKNLKRLSVSMNSLMGMPLGLQNFTRLEYLDLSDNKFITDVPPDSLSKNLLKLDLHYTGIKNFRRDTFTGLTKLTTLLLNDNRASSSLKFEEGVFDNLVSLKHIDLSRCYCKKMSRNSFKALQNLTTLVMNNCWLTKPPIMARYKSGHGADIWLDSGLVTSTKPETTELTTSAPITSVTSQPSVGIWYNPKLTLLDLTNNPRMSIKPGGTRLPPSLTELRLGYTNIPLIDNDLFNETSSIQKLDLCHSKIRTIARDAFMKFQNVSEICLSGNPLDGAPRLPASLLTLNLSETKISNLTRIILKDLSNVLEANIRNGKIEWLGDYAFSNMTALRKLDLSENKIEILQENALYIGPMSPRAKRHIESAESKSVIYEINLSSNLLIKMKPGAFASHVQLQILDLQHNFMEALIPDMFQGLGNLRKLFMNDNLLIDVSPGTFTDSPNLEILHLEENNIEVLFDETFKGLDKLKELYLGSNKLMLVHSHIFPSLQYLDMSNNNLTEFPDLGGPKLEEIEMSYNVFEHIAADSLFNAKNLQILHLTHCSIDVINYTVFASTPSLKKIDLTDNYISEFPNVKMSALEILEMEENEIESIDNSLVDVAPKLQHFGLSYNKISYINPAVFYGMTTLKEIDLTGNNFECDCNLLPLVNWIKKHYDEVLDAYSYLCEGPEEHYAMPVLDVVSELNCDPTPKNEPHRAQIYIGTAVAVILLIILLLLLLWLIQRRSRAQRLRNENGDAMLNDNADEIKVVSEPGCCSQCKTWCFGMNDFRRERAHRGRIVSEERRDLMVTSPVTSPIDKEAPTEL